MGHTVRLKNIGLRGVKVADTKISYVDGEKGVLIYGMMRIPLDRMTPVFAVAIVSGWCAHIIKEKFSEAQETPVLCRPKAEYIGNYCGEIGCICHPIEER